jgi:DNA-binding transcriptional LysR family regulator
MIMHVMPDSYPGDLLVALRSVIAVSSATGSPATYARAARAIHVDESVLRRRVAALAEHVGSPLFEGRGSAMRATREGKRVIEVASSALRMLDALGAPQAPGRIAIGCTGTVSRELLPPVLAELHRRHPELVVHVRRAGATQGLAGIEDGSLDFAVVRSEGPPARVASRFVAEDALWLAVPRGHVLARSRRFDPAQVAKFPLVTFRPGSSTRARIMRVLEPHGATARIEVDGRSLALRYVELGLGIALVSALRGRPKPRWPGIVFRDVTRAFEPVRFYVAWRAGRALAPFEDRVVRTLAQM